MGLEASGGLERNWEKFFRGLKSSSDLEVLLLNPLAVKKHLERNLRRNRTDKISARNIADYLACGRRQQKIWKKRDTDEHGCNGSSLIFSHRVHRVAFWDRCCAARGITP